jgi:TRAP-type mannitol/chloroaromatic compound transport system substrate-binding protein
MVAEATDNKFQISVCAGGEIAPPFSAADVVQNGTVEQCFTASYYFIGKDMTFALPCSSPFGPNTRMQNAWEYQHGGIELMNEFYKKFNIHALPAGNTGCQMGGWFRREIRTPADLNGLKFRIGGFAGRVLAKLGVVAQQIPGGEIYPALEKGTIDAAEWVGPYDDEKLGLHKVAKYYYFPGWWEGSAQVSLIVNLKQWEALPELYKAALETAANEQTLLMMAKYDARNPEALRRLVAAGVQLRQFPRPVMDACYKATFETYEELAAKNADFKLIYESWQKFLADSNLWFRVAENTLDNYRYAMSAQPR